MLEKLACTIIKDSKNENDNLELLEARFLSTPPIAIQHCKNVSFKMADMAIDSLKTSMNLIFEYDEKTAEDIIQIEDDVDKYEDALGSYLVKLSAKALSPHW